MVKTATAVVVEIDGPQNENLRFRPIGRAVRGRFDPVRLPDPGNLLQKFRDGIPGQRLGIDLETGEGFIEEPLQRPENAELRKRLAKYGEIAPERESFGKVDMATWLFWLKNAIEAGLAKIVEGSMPDVIDGKPQTSFITTPRVSPEDRLAAAIERQSALLAALLKK